LTRGACENVASRRWRESIQCPRDVRAAGVTI
jgi:hypothetical protein